MDVLEGKKKSIRRESIFSICVHACIYFLSPNSAAVPLLIYEEGKQS